MSLIILSVGVASVMKNHNLLDLTIRLSVAIISGGCIRFDRYIHHQSAGLKTHRLVSLDAALSTIVPIALTDRTDIEPKIVTRIESDRPNPLPYHLTPVLS